MVDGDGDIIVIEPVKEMLLQRQRPAVPMVTVDIVVKMKGMKTNHNSEIRD